jgi:hypothetical protein
MPGRAEGDLEFEAATPFGVRVRCTRAHWIFLVTEKHPALLGKVAAVIRTLEFPQQVRRSRADSAVLLFYHRHETRWLCAVIRIVADGAFLVTAYPTDALKAGEIVWTAYE